MWKSVEVPHAEHLLLEHLVVWEVMLVSGNLMVCAERPLWVSICAVKGFPELHGPFGLSC